MGGLGWIMSHYLETSRSPISEDEAARFADATKVFYQGEAGEITVEYISNLARVTGGAYDGMFFAPGQPFNQGNIFGFSEEDFNKGCDLAVEKAKSGENKDGLKLQEQTFKQTVDILMEEIKKD